MVKSGEKEVVGCWNKSCIIKTRLDNKLVIVTGANSGIGFAVTAELARRGARVIMACRSLERAEKAKQEILDKYGTGNANSTSTDIACKEMVEVLTPIASEQLIISQLDLASLQNVRQFAQRIKEQYTQLDYLVNNAAWANPIYEETVDGYEITMAVNHLAPFLLTQLLLPLLKKSDKPGRVIMVSSQAHKFRQLPIPQLFDDESTFRSMPVYSRTKLANVIYALELSKRVDGDGIVVVGIHPGIVKTDFARDVKYLSTKNLTKYLGFIMRTPWQGAQTIMYTVLSENIISGGYYENCRLNTPARSALDPEIRSWLWEKSCQLVGLSNSAE